MNTKIQQQTRRLVAVLAFLMFAVAPALQLQRDIRVEDVRGTGLASVLACIGCGVAAVGIVAGGLGAVLVAIHATGGGIAAAACIGACVDAVSERDEGPA